MSIDVYGEITAQDRTFTHNLNLEDLPTELHPLVQQYEEYKERAEAALYRLDPDGDQKKAANLRDALLLKDALLKGAKDPGTPNADKEAKEQAQAEREYQACNRIVRETVPRIIQGLQDHRQQIADIAAGNIAQALTAYEQAVSEAEEAVNTAATILDTAAPVLGLVDSIDSGTRNEIGYTAVQVPRFDTTKANKSIETLKERLNTIDQPGERQHRTVRFPDGRTMHTSADRAAGLVKAGAEYDD